MNDCLFCKIVSGDISCDKIFESELLIAFRDIAPVSPTHILIIPKKHISSLNEMEDGDRLLAGEMLYCVKKIAKSEKIELSGYRTVINTNNDGGQTVFHIHIHLIGGRQMEWPPG
tara:strand:+ start:1695 stop:2039 length:345 start_codon:yes stop_codon:yes gene_type:complete